MVAKILLADPSLTLRLGSKGRNYKKKSEHDHVACQIKGITNANILPTDPPPPLLTLGMGSIGQNSNFSERGHVTNQIKGNHQMQQHGRKYFARRPLPDP